MSLRPEFGGFSLAAFKALLGSGDRATLDAVLAEAEDSLQADDPESVRAILSQAILKGTFPGLNAENEHHVVAVALLVRRQSGVGTDSNIWKAAAFDELFEEIGADLPPKVLSLYQGLQNGRALLGRRIESSWSYYAWMTRPELDLVRRVLGIQAQKRPDPTGDGFLPDLRRWLDEIDAAGGDLWLYTC